MGKRLRQGQSDCGCIDRDLVKCIQNPKESNDEGEHSLADQLLGWLIAECRRFCQASGRDGLSDADREVLLRAFEALDWKALGNFSRNRQTLLRAIGDTLKGGLVTPGPHSCELSGHLCRRGL